MSSYYELPEVDRVEVTFRFLAQHCVGMNRDLQCNQGYSQPQLSRSHRKSSVLGRESLFWADFAETL